MMFYKKKIAAVLLVIPIILFSFTSCIQGHQLNETAIVQAIGIDWAEDQFEVTLQIYSPKGAGASTAIDTSKNNSSTITSSGKTLASAIRNATLSQGKKIFTGHNRIIIIGKSMAQQGIESLFSYFNRNALTLQNVQVLLAEETAKQIITANIDQGILAAETIQKMVDNSHENGFVYLSPYYLFSKNMIFHNGCGAVPIISLVPEKESSSQSGEENSTSAKIPEVTHLNMDKTAVFQDFKLAGTLDQNETRGLLFLSNQIKKTIFVTEEPNTGTCSIDVYQCKTKLTTDFEDGNLTFTLKVDARASLDEILTSNTKFSKENSIHYLEEACKKIIEEETKSAFETTVNQYHSDVFSLSDLILKEDSDLWKELEDDFYKNMPPMNLNTQIDFVIDRTGMETDEKI